MKQIRNHHLLIPTLLSAVSLCLLPANASYAQDSAAAAQAESEAAPAEAQDAPAATEEAPASDDNASDQAGDAAAKTEEAPAEGNADETAAPAEEAAPAEDAAAMGSLTLSSQPAGKVFLDDADTGLSTPLIDHPVKAGAHTLRVLEESTGREKTVSFHVEPGAAVNLNINLPEQAEEASDSADESEAEASEEVAEDAPAVEEKSDWTWMTVAGWSTLGLGTMGLLAGAIILTNDNDPNQGPLGFGLFGVGIGMVMGGGVLLYLDTQFLSDDDDDSGDEDASAASRLFLGQGLME